MSGRLKTKLLSQTKWWRDGPVAHWALRRDSFIPDGRGWLGNFRQSFLHEATLRLQLDGARPQAGGNGKQIKKDFGLIVTQPAVSQLGKSDKPPVRDL